MQRKFSQIIHPLSCFDKRLIAPNGGDSYNPRRNISSTLLERELNYPENAARLLELIGEKKAVIGITGMGYVGLPLMRAFCDVGFSVLGFDTDDKKVRALNDGRSYIRTVDGKDITRLRESGLFEATGEYPRLKEVDAVLICVPTPLDRSQNPDLSYVENTGRQIGANIRPGQIVILESTTYPGTTEEVLKPLLEESGLKCGLDFFLAYSPEREDPGNPSYRTDSIPKVVGAVDEASREIACKLYASVVVSVVPVSSPGVAEACKILENIYRSVNIALVNELKLLFDRMDIDIWEVIDAAATKPFGYHPFYPGPGLGGHCIPVDPFYLAWKARQYNFSTRFIELAGQINTAMPEYVVNKVVQALSEHGKALRGARVLLVGMAYKKDVDDMRESPGIHLADMLIRRGALVSYHDPYIPALPKTRDYDLRLVSVPLSEEVLAEQDCAVIITDHSNIDYSRLVERSKVVVDTRNATKSIPADLRAKVIKA